MAAAAGSARDSCREESRTSAPWRASSRAALADRAGAAQDQCPRCLQVKVPGGPTHGGGGRRVGAVGVEQHRHAQPELRQHVLAHLGQQLFPRGNVAAADEEGRAGQVLGPRVKMAPWTRAAPAPA